MSLDTHQSERKMHDILSWHPEDNVARLVVRKGTHVIAEFEPDSTEEDIRRALRSRGIDGLFDVFGKGRDGRFLKNPVQITVEKTPMYGKTATNILDHMTSVRRASSEGVESGGSVGINAAEYIIRQDDVRRKEAEEERKRTEQLHFSNLKRLEEERKRLEEERRAILETKAAEETATARREVEVARRNADTHISEVSRVSDNAVTNMRQFFETESRRMQQMHETQLASMRQSFEMQIQNTNSQRDMWQQRSTLLDAEIAKLQTQLRDVDRGWSEKQALIRDEARKELESALRNHREELSAMERKHREGLEFERKRAEEYQNAIRDKETQIMRLEIQLHNSEDEGERSWDIRELERKAALAQRVGMDPREIVESGLGMPPKEPESKRSMTDNLLGALMEKLPGMLSAPAPEQAPAPRPPTYAPQLPMSRPSPERTAPPAPAQVAAPENPPLQTQRVPSNESSGVPSAPKPFGGLPTRTL